MENQNNNVIDNINTMDVIKYLDKHNILWAYTKMKGKKIISFSNGIPFNGTFKLSSVNKKFSIVHNKCKTQEDYINLLMDTKNYPTDSIVYDTRTINCVDIDCEEIDSKAGPIKKAVSYLPSMGRGLPHFFCYIDTHKCNTPVGKIDMLKGQGAYAKVGSKVIVNENDDIASISYKDCCIMAGVEYKKLKKPSDKPKTNNNPKCMKAQDLIQILTCLNVSRFENFKEWFKLGSFIKHYIKNYEEQIMIFKLFSSFSTKHKMEFEELLEKFDKIPTNDVMSLECLLSWAKFDKPNQYNSIIPNLECGDKSLTKYQYTKKEFEKKFFYVFDSSCYGCETDKGDTVFKMNSQFKDDACVFDYEETLKNGNIKEINFFNKWKRDKTKRMYNSLDWIPSLEPIEGVYNTFKGFKLNEEYSYYDEDAVHTFINHLKLLTNNEDGCWEYLLKYIAHIFQKPTTLPAVAILIKSYEEGVGKDKLIDIIGGMLGDEYITRTSDMKQIVGTNNSALKQKLIIQLNEVQGKDGYEAKNVIKDLITRETNLINEKYIKITKYTNYTRLFLFSNNANPISIDHNDRRFIVFNTIKKESVQYYKKLNSLLDNENALKSILFYLKNRVDLSNFDIRNDRPKTSAYEEMANYNTHPIYEYLFEKYEYGKGIVKINNKTLQTNYGIWIDERDAKYKLGFRQLKCKLLMTGLVKYKRNSKNRYYEFDCEKLIEYLVEKYKFEKCPMFVDSDESDEENYLNSDTDTDSE